MVNVLKQHAETIYCIKELESMTAKNNGLKEKVPGKSQYKRQPTVAIAIRRTLLDKTLVYPSCARTKLKKGSVALLHKIELLKELVRITFFAGKLMMLSE
jgi:hypothetical protein